MIKGKHQLWCFFSSILILNDFGVIKKPQYIKISLTDYGRRIHIQYMCSFFYTLYDDFRCLSVFNGAGHFNGKIDSRH